MSYQTLRYSGTYFSPAVLHTPPSRHYMQSWTLIHRGKVAGHVVWYCPVQVSGTPSSSWEPVLETDVLVLFSKTAVDCLNMEPFLDSSFENWISKVCSKLLFVKLGALYKPSEIALITGCGFLWTITTLQSLPSTSFPITFLIRRMVEIDKSNLSPIYWAVRPASVNSRTIFRYRLDNIVCVYDITYCNTTKCLNKKEPLLYSLITFLCVTVPVYSSSSRLHAWSLACVSLRWFRGGNFFVRGVYMKWLYY